MTKAQALNKLMIIIGLLFVLLVALHAPAQTLHYNMKVELHPGLKMLKAESILTFPKDSPRKLSFLLHKDLQVSVASADDSIILLHPAAVDELYSEYGLSLGSQDNKVTLAFAGLIHDPVTDNDSSGLIAPEGAALFGSTYWYPTFLDTQKTFDIKVQTPTEWRSLVQGQITSVQDDGITQTRQFVEISPQEEIYLMAGPWTAYEAHTERGTKVQVFLRKDDPALAATFLKLVPEYIQHYSKTIGPFPYHSFSVIENFWETGYGMPGFTLLGPTVLRLPFILNSSLPHEVLHNWWGNGVYVDYDKGNWSEGLTTYLADHWQQQVQKNDRTYRLNALMSYMDFASEGKDMALNQFRGRHNASSQAVGYGKAMMLFHMLEFRFGPQQFEKALKHFYAANLFKKASYEDIRRSFEVVTGQDLTGFFSQWVERVGAPQLELTDVKVMNWGANAFSTTYVLSQKQEGPYDLVIPVIWKLESGEEVRQIARLSSASQVYSLVSKSRPVKISVDPDFHLFRQLYTGERPATLSAVLGAKEIHFYVNPENTQAADFIDVWKEKTEGQSYIHALTTQTPLSDKGALVFVGDTPEFRHFFKEALKGQDFSLTDKEIKVASETYVIDEVSTALVIRNPGNPEQPIVWVRWSADNNPKEWASRLTHYGSFGLLVFKGRPVVLKGTFPSAQSPLQRAL